eukprot:6777175-Prymnesium_polylepis.1
MLESTRHVREGGVPSGREAGYPFVSISASRGSVYLVEHGDVPKGGFYGKNPSPVAWALACQRKWME